MAIKKIKNWLKEHPREARLVFIIITTITIFFFFKESTQRFYAAIVWLMGMIMGSVLSTKGNPFVKEEVWITIDEVENGSNKDTKE